MLHKSLVILSLVLFSAVSGMRYDTKQASAKSYGTNTVTLPLIDDSTVSINYQTDCQDCECNVVSPLATLEKLRDIEFLKDIKQVFTKDDKIYVVHQGEFESVYFSIFSVDEEGVLTTIIFEEQKGSFRSAENIFFQHHDRTFFEFAKDHIIIGFTDTEGKFTREKVISYTTEADIYDVALLNNYLIIAKGEKGIEVLDLSTNNVESEEFWIEDLELQEDCSVTNLGVDPKQNMVYVFAPRNIGGIEVELLNIKNLEDVILVNKYELNVGDVVTVTHTDRRASIVSRLNGKDYLWQFITPERNGNITLWNQLEIPFRVADLVSDGHCSMIEGDDYIYSFENGYPGDPSLDLSLSIIKTEGDKYYLPFFMNDDSYLLSWTSRGFTVSRTSRDDAEYQCSVYKQNFEGTYKFKISVEKDVCPDYQKMFEEETCLFPYEYDVQFTGNDYKSKEVNVYQPHSIPLKVFREALPPKDHGGSHGGNHGNPTPGQHGGHSGKDDDEVFGDDPSDEEEDDEEQPMHGGHNGGNTPNQPSHGGNDHGGGHNSHDIPDIAPRHWKPRVDYKREIQLILANPIFIGVMTVLLIFMTYQLWRIWKTRQFTHQELREDEEEESEGRRAGTLEIEGPSSDENEI